jgi:uncharacterized membrane protein YgdD (TMEM256/DUF423 family)
MVWILTGAAWGFLGVGLGAFGAHGLRATASTQAIGWWQTATLYHLIHALALVAVGLVQLQGPRVAPAGWAFLLGSLVFSGTLYAMALGAPRWLGAVTPVGGLGMMAGWLLLAWRAYRLLERS